MVVRSSINRVNWLVYVIIIVDISKIDSFYFVKMNVNIKSMEFVY